MKKTETKLQDAFIIEPNVLGDNRGWFFEAYNKKSFEELGIYIDFVQDNHSYNEKAGVLRGLHCQTEPYAQTKLVRCLRGAIEDYIVDIREGSPTYMQWISVVLSGENKKQLLVPKGFLHGFVALEDHSEVLYKVDNFYSKECDRSIKFDDPVFGIEWKSDHPDFPVLSEKDMKAPLYKDRDFNFKFRRVK